MAYLGDTWDIYPGEMVLCMRMAGSVTISIEIELGWGQHDKGGSDICSPERTQEERYLERLLDVSERFSLPLTFDIVGHLLLSACDGEHDGPHENGWFAADPGGDADSEPLFYWPTVIDRIKAVCVQHEIATHTFSHVLCDGIEDRTLEWELDRCAVLHQGEGLGTPTSFVPPRHRPPSYQVLRRSGIEAIRVPGATLRPSKAMRSIRRAREWILERGHPVFEPTRRNGLVELYTTPHPSLTAVHLPNGQLSTRPQFKWIPASIRLRKHRSYLSGAIDAAAETGLNAHLWSHLYNLSNESQWRCVKPFLERLGEAQRTGDIDVLTMADLAHRY